MGRVSFIFLFRWVSWAPGIPRCVDAQTEADLHPDVRFGNEKKSDFQHSLQYAYVKNVKSDGCGMLESF